MSYFFVSRGPAVQVSELAARGNVASWRLKLRITVIGCGYVGLVTGTCLAEVGHQVVCTDNDAERIATLKAGVVPIYEPHLDAVLTSNLQAKRLSFTGDAADAVQSGEAIFICVGTPPKENGEADLSAIDNVARLIATEAHSSKLVIEKSTVPAQTDRKSTRLNSSHRCISYAVFCLK